MCGENSQIVSTVFRIWDKETKQYVGSYSRAYHDEYDFNSREDALNANCHGMFKNPKYEIHECIRRYDIISNTSKPDPLHGTSKDPRMLSLISSVIDGALDEYPVDKKIEAAMKMAFFAGLQTSDTDRVTKLKDENKKLKKQVDDLCIAKNELELEKIRNEKNKGLSESAPEYRPLIPKEIIEVGDECWKSGEGPWVLVKEVIGDTYKPWNGESGIHVPMRRKIIIS